MKKIVILYVWEVVTSVQIQSVKYTSIVNIRHFVQVPGDENLDFENVYIQ